MVFTDVVPTTTNTEAGIAGGKGAIMASTITFLVECPCGCGTAVTAQDTGFSATTVEIEACPMWAANGIVTSTMRKSWAYSHAMPVSAGWAHRDGLVTLTG